MTTGSCHELNWAKSLQLPKGSTAVFDRGFNDYGWYNKLTQKVIYFVTWSKNNTVITPLKKCPGRKPVGVIDDQTVLLGPAIEEYCQVIYQSPDDGHIYHFLTNDLHLSAKLVAKLYKERWQIEIFFKWIKQNLKVKTFLETSSNVVKNQI